MNELQKVTLCDTLRRAGFVISGYRANGLVFQNQISSIVSLTFPGVDNDG